VAPGLGQKPRDRLSGSGHDSSRGYVRQRNEDEQARRHPRVRDREGARPDLLVAVEEEVEIQGARSVPHSIRLSSGTLFKIS
jgi:hypothetical protein